MSDVFLKPCPFCGKDVASFATVAELEDCKYFENEKQCPQFEFYACERNCMKHLVVCNVIRGGCGVSTRYFWEKGKAAEAWNRRDV